MNQPPSSFHHPPLQCRGRGVVVWEGAGHIENGIEEGLQRARSPLPCILCPTSLRSSSELRALFPVGDRNMADRFAEVNIRGRNNGWKGRKKRGAEEVEPRNTQVKSWKVQVNSNVTSRLQPFLSQRYMIKEEASHFSVRRCFYCNLLR